MADVLRKRPVRPPPLTPSEVRELRASLGLDQWEFASLLETQRSCVQRWEKGEGKMPRGLAKLARIAASEEAYREMRASLPAPSDRVRKRQHVKAPRHDALLELTPDKLDPDKT